MLIRFRSGLFAWLLALALAGCQGAAPTGVPTPRPTTAAPAPTPTPGLSRAPFSDSLLIAVVKNPTDGAEIYPVDPLTGRRLEGFAPIQAKNYFYAFSADMGMLALITFAGDHTPSDGQLHLLSLKDWKDQVFDLKLNGWVNAIRFSPNGEMLAVAYGDSGSKLMIFDTTRGTARAQAETDIIVRLMRFTSDNRSLMLYGPAQQQYTQVSTGAPKAILLAARDLSATWTAELAEIRDGLYPKTEKTDNLHAPGQAWYFVPGAVFAPDRDALYIVHANEDKLTSVDFAARSIHSVDIRPRLSWFEWLLSAGASVAHAKIMDGTDKQMVISPDGGRLYVVGIRNTFTQGQNGEWDLNQTSLGLQVIDAKDGSQIGHYETDATNLAISSDGRRLYLRGWDSDSTAYTPWTEVFETAGARKAPRQPGLYLTPARSMGGNPILVSEQCVSETKCELAAFDAQDLSMLYEFSVSRYGSWLIP